MKTLLQTLRRPVKTLFGILLIALAVSVLCVCLGQSFAAEETKKALDEIYISAAFPNGISEDCVQWLNQYVQEHPDVVKQQSHIGIASAYIPDLTVDNWTQYIHKPLVNSNNMCAPHNTAMLEIKLVSVGLFYYEINALTPDENTPCTMEVEGVVERVIGLQEGYADPTGYTVRITLHLANLAERFALDLQPGERYLVYGVDYMDQDFVLRNSLAKNLGNLQYTEATLPYWDTDRCEVEYAYSDITVDAETGEIYYTYSTMGYQGREYFHVQRSTTDVRELRKRKVNTRLDYIITPLTPAEIGQFHLVTMNAINYGTYPQIEAFRNEYGIWNYKVIEERSYLDENGQKVILTQEEYAQRYETPTIVRLTGTAEEFLSSEEGALWANALKDIQVNNHAFAFVGVDKLRYVENFTTGEIKIIEGREFTEAELSSGAKVCVISKQLAQANGLKLGDTIDPQFYDPDQSLCSQLQDNSRLPKPMYFFGNTTNLRPSESYTIVGIYEQNNAHPNISENERAFTCNTIFAPKNALQSTLQQGESYIFQTIVVHNGKLVQFLTDAVDAGFGKDFHATDSGYSTVSGSLESYQKNAKRSVTVGVSVYSMILLLYLLLYPTQQGKNLTIMKALGSSRIRQMWHVVVESLLILTLGTAIGGVAGMLLWDSVVELLTQNSTYALNIMLPGSAFVKISLAQLGVSAALVAVLSVFVTHGTAMKKRN